MPAERADRSATSFFSSETFLIDYVDPVRAGTMLEASGRGAEECVLEVVKHIRIFFSISV